MKSKGVTPIVATMLLLVMAVAAVASASVFLEGTVTDIRDGLEDDLEREDRISSSDIRVEEAYEGSDGDIIVDIRNSGSVTLDLVDEGDKLWSLYVDGAPEEWEIEGSQQGEDDVRINPNGLITINTGVDYPGVQDSKEISFNAPYETSDSYICFNEGGTRC